MARLRPYFPKSQSKPRVDDRRVLNGNVLANRNELRWRDASNQGGRVSVIRFEKSRCFVQRWPFGNTVTGGPRMMTATAGVPLSSNEV